GLRTRFSALSPESEVWSDKCEFLAKAASARGARADAGVVSEGVRRREHAPGKGKLAPWWSGGKRGGADPVHLARGQGAPPRRGGGIPGARLDGGAGLRRQARGGRRRARPQQVARSRGLQRLVDHLAQLG